MQYELERQLKFLKFTCKDHYFRPLTEEEKEDKWMSVSAVCEICGERFGWRCLKRDGTKTPYCDYVGNGGEDCKHCGMPSERK